MDTPQRGRDGRRALGGGNPWNKDTKEGAVYGWAAWNKNKATLALRNSSGQEKSLTGTLCSILGIPANVKGSITFKDSYDDQRALHGFSGSSADIDKELVFTLKPFEVLVFEGGRPNKSRRNFPEGLPPATKKRRVKRSPRRLKKQFSPFFMDSAGAKAQNIFSNVTASRGSEGLTGITRHSAFSPPRYSVRLMPGE